MQKYLLFNHNKPMYIFGLIQNYNSQCTANLICNCHLSRCSQSSYSYHLRKMMDFETVPSGKYNVHILLLFPQYLQHLYCKEAKLTDEL